jgi:hypothetical protein
LVATVFVIATDLHHCGVVDVWLEVIKSYDHGSYSSSHRARAFFEITVYICVHCHE